MEERISKYNLILDDVAIINLKFGPDFSKAIENKQIAQQEAETQVCYAILITLNRVGYGGIIILYILIMYVGMRWKK